MFFEKEEGALPDLPPVKSPFNAGIGEQEEEQESHALPSFPDSPAHNKFSQDVIKDAVGIEGSVPDPPKEVGVVEMKEWSPTPPSVVETGRMEMGTMTQREEGEALRSIAPPPRIEHELGQGTMSPATQTKVPQNVDVFVKIDKFHSAKKTLSEVRDKLDEIDTLIKKIREVKLREEQEISSWEKDLVFAKSRMQEISENIFDKVA